MKYLLLIISFFLLPLSSWSQEEREPNDKFTSANSIQTGTVISGFINPQKDKDYFKFQLSEPAMIKVELFEVPGNVDLDAILYKSDYTKILDAHAKRGQLLKKWVSACDVGEYVLFIKDGAHLGSEANSEDGYTFRIDIIPFSEVDVCECQNGSFKDAFPIAIGQVIEAVIAPKFGLKSSEKDKDYYKFTTTEPGIIKLEFFEVPGNLDLDANIYQADRIQILDAHGKRGRTIKKWVSTCYVGDHILYIKDGVHLGSESNTDQQYRFRVDFTPFSTVDISECNNSFKEATAITTCDTIQASIAPPFFKDKVKKDVDFYKLTVTKNGQIPITINTVPSNADLCIAVYDSQKVPISDHKRTSRSQPIKFNLEVEQAGDYYLKIFDCRGKFNLDGEYTLYIGCP